MCGFWGLLMGSVAGFVLGQLYAPKSGRELRRELMDATDEVYRRVAFEIEDIRTSPGGVAGFIERLTAADEPRKLVDMESAANQ